MTIALLARRGKFYQSPGLRAKLGKSYQDYAQFYSLMEGEVFARDIVKGNNLAPVSGSNPVSVIRPWGKSLNFDGSSQYLVTPRDIAPLSTISVMAWVRPSVLNTSYRRIAETDYATHFYLGGNTGSQYAFITNNASLEGCVGGQQVAGRRDFVVGEFDGFNRSLYVNGVLVASATATAPAFPQVLFVGRSAQGPAGYWNGDIDHVAIFSKTFGAENIRQIYQDQWWMFESPKRFIGFNISAGGGTVTLIGSACTQANPSGTGAITLAHNLTGAASTQVNPSSTGAITQAHVLTGANCVQANQSSTGVITQTHVISGAAASQDNLSSSGAVTVGASITLTGANCTQVNPSGTGAITQTHVLTGSASTQANPSASGAITQDQVLTGANCTQANASSTGAITESTGILIGAPCTQVNLGGVGQITRPQTFTGANCVQENRSSTGAWSTGIVFESALIAGDIAPPDNLIIKKPGIPAGTPDWEKTMFEILTGRRGNAIPIPVQPALTFSSTPTKAECEALFAYVNTVRDAQEKLITRFDS